jgi:AcrR family transcriptional regulator
MARSGVGQGSFYARFQGRRALLAYLEDRFWERIHSGWLEFLEEPVWGRAEIPALAGEMVRRLVRGHARHEARLRASMVYALRQPEGEAMERILETDDLLMSRLSTQFVRAGASEEVARVALHQLLAGLRALVLFPDATPFPPGVSEEDLILRMTRNLMSGLGVPGGPESYGELLRRSAGLYR